MQRLTMQKLSQWTRNGLMAAVVFALGLWLGSSHPVRASSSDWGGVQFQLTGSVDPSSSLLVYEPESHTVYVYRGATTGSDSVPCAFKFILNRPGAAVRRVNCDVPGMGR